MRRRWGCPQRQASTRYPTYCWDKATLLAHAATVPGAVLTDNHPRWALVAPAQGGSGPDDPLTCGCNSFGASCTSNCCDSSFTPKSGSRPDGFDQRVPLMETGLINQPHRDWASNHHRWNLGSLQGVTFGGDNHGTKCTEDKHVPHPDLGAGVVWALGQNRTAILEAMRARRTYTVQGFCGKESTVHAPTAGEPAVFQLAFQDEPSDPPVLMGETVLVSDGDVNVRAHISVPQCWIDDDPANHELKLLELVHNVAPPVDNTVMADVEGTVVASCDIDAPTGDCTCSGGSGGGATSSCTLSLTDFAVTDGWYYLRGKTDRFTTFNSLGSDLGIAGMTSPIWVNRCAYIAAQGSGVPCGPPVPSFPYMSVWQLLRPPRTEP